jgi:hypothetical protein
MSAVMRRWCAGLVVAAAAGLLLAPISPSLVERWYSTGVYLRWQPLVTRVSNRVPFALFDLLLVAVVIIVLAIALLAVRGLRRGQGGRALGVAAVRLLTVSAVLYLWFALLWGLNYRRVPLLDRLALSADAPSGEAVAALGRRSVEALNRLHGEAHAGGWTDPWRNGRLRKAYRRTQHALSDGRGAMRGRLKRSVIGPYFRWASVDGMVDPFALEVLVNPDLLPFEKPFVAAHEWAHLAGYAQESEASFIGFLTCMRAGVPEQYSGWLFLYWEILGAAGPADRASLSAALAAGPRADLTQVAERVRRGQLPQLRAASWAAYDQYLKANRVTEGVRSYNEVVTLLVRARFTKGWVPVRIAQPPPAPADETR